MERHYALIARSYERHYALVTCLPRFLPIYSGVAQAEIIQFVKLIQFITLTSVFLCMFVKLLRLSIFKIKEIFIYLFSKPLQCP